MPYNGMELLETKLKINLPESVTHNDRMSNASKLLGLRRKLAELEEALQMKKEEFKITMAGLETRKVVLDKKELKLQGHLAQYDKYIQENDMKKAKASRKAQNERVILASKQKELTERRKSATVLTNERDDLRLEIDEHMPYVRYLTEVTKREEFNEIRDVIFRYETLSALNKELRGKDEKMKARSSSDRQYLNKYVLKKNASILSLNGQLNHLCYKYDQLKMERERLESMIHQIELTAGEETLEIGKVRMAAYSMYHLVLKRSVTMAMFHRGDVLDPSKQLDQIKTYINDLLKIVEEIKTSPEHEAHLRFTQSTVEKMHD